MKQEKFMISLSRKIDGEYKVIESKEVYEFNDECLLSNLYYQAISEFKDIIQVNDIIHTGKKNENSKNYPIYTYGEYRYNEDGNGTVLYENR